jgi:osmotically-inducible protein OsmY
VGSISRKIEDDVRAELASHRRLPYPDEIRGAAPQRLLWDTEIPGDALWVGVKDGWVTLNGEVLFQLQSDEAFNRVASLHGVTSVTDRITVVESR